MRILITVRRLIVPLLLLALLHYQDAGAQERSGFSPSLISIIGYESGTASTNWTHNANRYLFENGRTASVTGGIGIELPFELYTDRPFLRDLVLIPALTFRRTDASFVRSLPDALVLLPGQSDPITQILEQRFAFTMQDLGLDIQLLYRIWKGLGFKVGMQFGYRSFPKWRLTQHLLEPANARFANTQGYPSEDGGKTLVFSNGSDVETSPFGVVASNGLVYDLQVTPQVALLPEFGMSYMLPGSATPVGSGSWKSFAYSGRLSIRWRIDDEDPPTTPIVFPAPSDPGDRPPARSIDSIPVIAPLAASIDLFTLEGGERRQTMRLVTIETRRNQERGLVPVVRFENGSSTPAAGYRLLDAAGAARFRLDSIARLDSASVHSQLLNIVGARLAGSSRERLRLVAKKGRGESADSAYARAAAVRQYLVDVWKIPSSRLTIDIGTGEGTDVRLIGSRTLLAPLSAEWIERSVVASALQIDPRVSGGVGPRSWTLTLRRGEDLVARHSSDDTGPLAIDLALGVPGAGERLLPIAAELTVRDHNGATVTARDTIELVTESGVNPLERKEPME